MAQHPALGPRRGDGPGGRAQARGGPRPASAARGGEGDLRVRPRPALAERAPAKLNLHLHVLGRRGDGLHEIDSLIAFLDVHDTLRGEPADGLSLRTAGPFAGAVAAGGGGNLAMRAAEALAEAAGAGAGARLVLEKRIPPGAGLGGGTADGAAAIRLLCLLWGLDPAGGPALRAAEALGADGPACLLSRTLVARGAGGDVRPLGRRLEGDLLLVHPGARLSTADVYAAHGPPWSRPAPPPSGGDVLGHLSRTRNDLEAAAFRLSPEARAASDALAALPGARAVRMTGSGSASFALMESAAAAEAAARSLRRSRPGWWIVPARTAA